MSIEWRISSPDNWQADVLIWFGFEGEEAEASDLCADPPGALPWLRDCPALSDFKGKAKQISVAYGPADAKVARCILAGLGKRDKFDLNALRDAVVSAFRRCRDLKLVRVGLPLALFDSLPELGPEALKEALISGLLGLYSYDRYKTRDRNGADYEPACLLLTEEEPAAGKVPPDLAGEVEAIVEGVKLARDLTSGPGNDITPAQLLARAEELATRFDFKLQSFDLDQAAAMGMGAFVAVAKGSREPARFIVLEYAPEGCADERPIVLVGKGITFDTGGISLKPSAKMEAMKGDMAGAAAVLGTFNILGQLRPPRRVVGILPCTENMPDGKAYKPGDIVKSLAGLNIEVVNTDAEGRMILCDALAYGERYQPAAMIDIATLTGACIIALGDRVAGLLGNHDELRQTIRRIGDAVGERFWPLPLWDFYFDDIKSDCADFKNVGNRQAGTIIGAMFLKQFVAEETPWAHLDIAGPSWLEKDLMTTPKGATGFGVRTLFELVRRWK